MDIMLDKEWLNKVMIGLVEFERQYGKDRTAMEFVSWLYQQYGIKQPE